MPKEEHYCRAIVTVTLEVRSEGHWGSNATVAEVQQIGGRETINAINQMITTSRIRAKIVGEPKVGAITWSDK